jgi:serine/threonine protein kinase
MACLSDEIIVTFARGDLTGKALDVVETHLAACPDCCALVAETAQLLRPPSANPTSPAAVLAPGTTISRYVIEEALGAGGGGVVYRAYDPELGRRVAIKLLRGVLATDWTGKTSSRSRQLQEAKAMARMAHPNIVNVHDVGSMASASDPDSKEDSAFIVMELVQGPNVAQWLKERPRNWREIVDVFVHAGRGLAAAHAAGLVHRDLKPENILVGIDGRTRVADFGLAQLEAATGDNPLAGTPVYMAPEQLLGKGGDARSDQFSFCVALYAALYGRRPFPVSEAVKNTLLDPPAVDGPSQIPSQIHEVLRRGLAADPEARFATMDDLLAGLLASAAPPPPPMVPPPPRRLRDVRRLIWMSGTLLMVVSGFLVQRWTAKRNVSLAGTTCLSRVAIGLSFACGIASDTTVWCWGKV